MCRSKFIDDECDGPTESDYTSTGEDLDMDPIVIGSSDDEARAGPAEPKKKRKTLGARRRQPAKPKASRSSSNASKSGAKSKQPRGRNFCFTINTDAARAYRELKEQDMPADFTFIVFQGEFAPTTKRLHIQGYVQLSKQHTISSLKNVFGDNTMHLEIARGSAESNIKYCTKEEGRAAGYDPVMRGELKKQGQRTDLGAVAAKIKNKEGFKSIAEDHPREFMMYHKGMLAYKRVVDPPRERPAPSIKFLWGKPGCGKSRLVRELNRDKEESIYYAEDTRDAWLDGYIDEKTIVFDDFEGNFPIRRMLKLLDRVPMQLPVKGGFVTIKATEFWFTSNNAPSTFYNEVSHDAWMRRINEFADVWDEDRVAQELAAGQCLRSARKYYRALLSTSEYSLICSSPGA